MKKKNMSCSGWTAVALFWIIFIVKDSLSVEITNLNVPDHYVIDDDTSNDNLILDCEYELDENKETSFVLKWFKDDNLIYQWISSSAKPTALSSSMKHQIDTTYEASANKLYKYRSLYIENVNVNNTGLYKCQIITNKGLEFKSDFLQVIDTSQNYTIDVYHVTIENETEVICTVSNVYPKPELKLWANDDKLIPIKTDEVITENGLYSVKVTGILPKDDDDDDNDDDDDDDSETFKCTLHIAGTNYTQEVESFSASSDLYSFSFIVYLIMATLLILQH